jgi:uncharacterized protein (DUF4415 family)
MGEAAAEQGLLEESPAAEGDHAAVLLQGMKKLAAERHAKLGRRPIGDKPKVHIGFRLEADLVVGIRASGPEYNARLERVLRAALGTAVAVRPEMSECKV